MTREAWTADGANVVSVKSERPEDTRLEKIGIGLMRGAGERGGQKIEAEVGVGDRSPGREQQRIGLEPGGEGVGGDVDEGIVRRPRRMGDLARQPGRMGGEIDKPDRPPALRHRRDELGRVFGQRIGEADHAVRGEARQDLAGERLGDRADPEQRIRAGGLVRVVGAAAEALDRRLPAVDDAEDERRGLDRQEQDLAGEADRFVEQGLACPRGTRPRQGRAGKEAEDIASPHAFSSRKISWGCACGAPRTAAEASTRVGGQEREPKTICGPRLDGASRCDND